MSMICGLWKRGGGEAIGLDHLLAALPRHEADTEGKWSGPSVSLGWRGRSPGQGDVVQSPCFDGASRLAVTASVRLDGRAALCEELGLRRPDRERLSDSALILKSYVRWGPACPEHLVGDYAFALWDANREVLFCVRDHIGARPFYYALAGERLVFASDMNAVLASPGVSGELDEAAVATRLTYGARSLGERTCYRAVRRLLPGHALCVERGGARTRRWWRPEEVRPLPATSDGDLAEACLMILSEAVRDRVRDVHPVGVHLSGGLDSSAVAALAGRELRRRGHPPPTAFSWHPPPTRRVAADEPEYRAIEAMRRRLGLRVYYRPPTARDVVAFLRRDGMRYDEGTLVHEEVVQRAAAEQGVKVLLSGWGGDEGISFNGRGYYRQLLRSREVIRLWRELRERSARPLAVLGKQAVLSLVSPGVRRAARRLRQGRWTLRENVTFIHPGFARRVCLLPARRPPHGGVREMQLYLLQLGHLSRRMDGWSACGARYGIEYRYPLLDRRVLEFALSLPPEQYRNAHGNRRLMRRALDLILPPEVCWNPNKSDPARFERLRTAVAEALPVVRGMILGRRVPPRRSGYVDLPRVVEHLDAERWSASGRFMPVLNAVRFLDF